MVIGQLPYGGDIITLVDMDAKEVKDEIYGYGLNISSSGQYLIYEKYFPRFAQSDFKKKVVILYDLSKSPSDNRVTGKAMPDDHENVGLPLYPQENRNNNSLDIQLGAPEDSNVQELLWLSDDLFLFFIADSNDIINLVYVQLKENARSVCEMPLISRSIPKNQFFDAKKYIVSRATLLNKDELSIDFYSQSRVNVNMKVDLKDMCN